MQLGLQLGVAKYEGVIIYRGLKLGVEIRTCNGVDLTWKYLDLGNSNTPTRCL